MNKIEVLTKLAALADEYDNAGNGEKAIEVTDMMVKIAQAADLFRTIDDVRKTVPTNLPAVNAPPAPDALKQTRGLMLDKIGLIGTQLNDLYNFINRSNWNDPVNSKAVLLKDVADSYRAVVALKTKLQGIGQNIASLNQQERSRI